MLELGLTPFSPDVKKFSTTHWLVFYSAILERESQWFDRLAELLGIKITRKNFVPFGYIVNSEMMKEVEKLREVEKLKEEKPEYGEMSAEELKYVLEEIEKEVKSKEEVNQKMEW